MTDIESQITLVGTLMRDNAGFMLRADGGLRYHLQLHRVPVDHIQKRVRITGRLIGEQLIEAESVAPV